MPLFYFELFIFINNQDRVYVVNNGVYSVYDLGLKIFREQVALSEKIKPRMVALILESIFQERNGEVINRQSLKSITQMLVEIGINSREIYEKEFEQTFLEESAKFYLQEAESFITQTNCAEYLKKAECRLSEEEERVDHYLDASTEQKIREVAENELIKRHLQTLLEMEGSGEEYMLKNDKVEDLNRMYLLTGRIQKNHESMRSILHNLVKETGRAIVMDKENQTREKTYVQALIELKDKYDTILIESFGNDKNFQQSLNQAFEYFLNMNSRSPEFVSLYISELLKKGNKEASEGEIEKALDKVMTLFRFIQEKDVFEKYYKQHLAKRLLLNRSRSDDAERMMISKLKTECGYQFTSKLEGMFNDMKLSSDTMDAFKDSLSTYQVDPLRGIDISVNILSAGNWPSQPTTQCIFPEDIQNCCSMFEKFYMSNHSGRRLTWQCNMGTADVKAYFARRHELTVSTYQMVILLQFNGSKVLSFKNMLDVTGIPIQDLKRNLLSLIKHKIILTNVDKEAALDEAEFEVNDKFKHKLVKIKITQVVQKETEAQRMVTTQKVDNDRKFMIEAAIVRTMKSRKVLDHANLVVEVTKQLSSRFRPNPLSIKKRIESLIEREYLVRSSENRQVYHYLA